MARNYALHLRVAVKLGVVVIYKEESVAAFDQQRTGSQGQRNSA